MLVQESELLILTLIIEVALQVKHMILLINRMKLIFLFKLKIKAYLLNTEYGRISTIHEKE